VRLVMFTTAGLARSETASIWACSESADSAGCTTLSGAATVGCARCLGMSLWALAAVSPPVSPLVALPPENHQMGCILSWRPLARSPPAEYVFTFGSQYHLRVFTLGPPS
jgi:hypothetical protein